MVKQVLVALFLFLARNAYTQEAQNKADLDFLYQSIKKMPSYKDQLKNDKSYQLLYERLGKALNSEDEFTVYQQLLQLIFPIQDNHLGFYKNPESPAKFNFLKLPANPDETEAKYLNYPIDSLEGIYYRYDDKTRYVVYRNAGAIYYLQNLTTGIVEVILNKTSANGLDAIQFLNPSVPYALHRNVKFSGGILNGVFNSLYYQKSKPQNYAALNTGDEKYEYKELQQNIGYLRLSSFNSSNANIKIATDFFQGVKSNMNTQHLIVDLRDNWGGGYKTSGQFISFLKKFKGKIYILQNSNTMSNAEQFIIDIKDKKNVITLGATTRGTITYGSNYGRKITLPSKRFLFYPTDMSGRAKDLAFESTGIKPDQKLDTFTEDWISQTVKYIKANYP